MQDIEDYAYKNLEEFVLSSNRRKLLEIEGDDEISLNISSILYGSTEHLYYHLLQIENEITSILINENDLIKLSQNDTDKIKCLLNEANDIIIKYNKNEDKSSHNVDIMSFRHKLRKLFLSQYIGMEQETKTEDDDEKEVEDIFDILINKVGVKFNHSKPNDIAITNNDDENDEKISSIMPQFDLLKTFDSLFSKCKHKNDIKSYFTKWCLPLLLQQDYENNPELIEDLFELTEYNKDGLSILKLNRMDLYILCIKNTSNNTITIDSITYKYFTLHELNTLSAELPKLWKHEQFLLAYMEKLMPIQVSFYLDHTDGVFIEQIPLYLATKCYETAVNFVLTHQRCNFLPHQKANILINYLKFKQERHVCYDYCSNTALPH